MSDRSISSCLMFNTLFDKDIRRNTDTDRLSEIKFVNLIKELDLI